MRNEVERDDSRRCAGHATEAPDQLPLRMPARMNNSDFLLWDIERDPTLRSTIVSVSLLDHAPDWSKLRHRVAAVCELVPRMRQHAVPVSFRVGPPRWQPDPFFDLDYHLHRIGLPTPGDLRSVFDLAAQAMMTSFDKDRPLWDFTLVEGLPNGQAALIKKVHHSFTDGVGAIELARLLFDERRVPRRRRSAAPPTAVDKADRGAVLEALVDDAVAIANTTWHVAEAAPGITIRAVADPYATFTSTGRGLRSLAKLLAPVSTPLSPIMTDRSLSRWMDAFDVSKSDLRDAGRAADCSLNDAFLAAVTGGLRRFHEMAGSPVDSLRVTMPISQRRPDDPSAGNRFVPARFTLPISTVDPTDRIREISAIAHASRQESALGATDVIAGALTHLPAVATTAVFGSMLKAIDFVATNVPGLEAPAFLAGAEVVREYAFGPPSGAAMSIALLSHIDRCCVGVTVDTAAVRDPAELMACLRAGFDEVIALGEEDR